MKAFISHISEEALEARALKISLEAAIPGGEFFVSASDIHLGDAWLKVIDDALVDAKLILSLCSPNSVRRPWINFESGSGWSRQLPVVPLCYKGLRRDQLPDPLHIFQGVELTNATSFRHLVERIASVLGQAVADDFDPARMLQALQVEGPSRTHDIGIVLCHRQGEWEPRGRSVFALPRFLPEDQQESWSFRVLDDERVFLSARLHELSGLILANPWRARMEAETISAIVEWVKAGGRLLLLGFELGDRHHNGNLAELSHHFGIDPASDIVGPREYGDLKPYNVTVDFSPSAAEQHPFTKGLTSIRLTNVQTVRVEPGGIEWLRVGSNIVYRPRRDSVQYHGGTMTTPGGAAFESRSDVGWMPIAVEAPHGLCGAGSVQMIGSWDLLGRDRAFNSDNLTFLTRLLYWLSGKTS
jgi:hypothetical protein